MQLQSEDKLIWSPTVANSRMNRSRNSSGINSYEQDIGFAPEDYLQQTIVKNGRASWLDLCCGEGNALLQVYNHFSQTDQLENIKLAGLDLIKPNKDFPGQINVMVGPLLKFISNEKFDLITCIHGLHYIGDKLEAIGKVSSLLTREGLFIANLDINDFAMKDTNTSIFLKSQFGKNGLKYNLKRKLIEKHGSDTLSFECVYLGANDEHGQNYTGQESVKSYYISN